MITKDVPDGALAVERSEQRTVEGYRTRKDAERRRRKSRKKDTREGRVEIITGKRMMLFTGTIHPALAHEIADCLSIPVSESDLRRFASGEIYSGPRRACAAPTCSWCRPTTSPSTRP